MGRMSKREKELISILTASTKICPVVVINGTMARKMARWMKELGINYSVAWDRKRKQSLFLVDDRLMHNYIYRLNDLKRKLEI